MEAWERFVAEQEAEIGGETVEKWLKTLKVLRFDAGNIHLEANDTFQAMWFEEHIRQKVSARLLNSNRRRIKVHLTVVDQPVKAKTKIVKKGALPKPATPPAFTLTFDPLDSHAVFDTFVEKKSDALTCKVFHQIAETNDTSSRQNELVTPIYLHGGSGAGKTHLLMATAHALREKGIKVVYSRAQVFADHVVAAIRAGEMSAFRHAYRNCDVLIIDDVHVLSRKSATQEEFFHTFNTHHIAGKMIILSANCPPKELQFIEPRLVSRFEWGLVVSLEVPGREVKGQVMQAKIKALDFPLHLKVCEFLLDTFASTKSLCRALEALVLRCHMNAHHSASGSMHLTAVAVKQILQDIINEEEALAITPEGILHCVGEHFGIPPEDILGKGQTRDCVLPRQIAMHLCRTMLELPYLKIGGLFCRDHSTVISSVKLIQKGIDSDDSEIASSHRAIMRKIKV